MERADIKKWVASNASGLMPLTLFTLDDNDFSKACFQADDTNKKALYLYALFLANKLPMDYRKKAIRGG